MTTRYFDRDSNEIPSEVWMHLLGDPGYRLLQESTVGACLVRTMWEGADDGVHVAPMWTTGVRNPGGTWQTVWEGYYPCTREEALAMHGRVVAKITRSGE